MQRRPGGLLLLAFAFGFAAQTRAQFSYQTLANQAAPQSGEGTYYGAGQDAQGTCSFSSNFANTNDLPWTTGAALTLALNDAQFANGVACGLCVMFKGTGAGLGTVPIPSTYTLGFVNNRCPECSAGDLDLATSGDGRWRIQWYAVPCNVGTSPLKYSIVVSSYYWFSLVVSNTRYPVTDVSIQLGGSWLPLRRSSNNQWAYYNTNGPWQSAFPMPIKVTNVLGETVQDTITGAEGNTGTVQFSGDGSGATSASGGGGNATMATPPALPGSLQTTPAAAPPTVPTTPPASPPVAQSPPTPLADGNFYIEDYQQCGGSGSFCNQQAYSAAPCQDIAWPRATCRSSRFACTRYDASLWSCIPNSNISYPPPMVWTAPPTGMPPAQAAVQAVPPSSPLPTLAAPPTLPSNLQSQGPAVSLAGNSPSPIPASPPVVISSPPPVTASPPAVTMSTASPPVASTQQAAATTSPSPSPPVTGSMGASPPASGSTGSPPPTPTGGSSGGSLSIADGGQCGGTSQCAAPGVPTDKVTCNNGPWTGAYCSSGFSCQPDPGPLIWSCKSASVATGGRRLLGSS